MQQMEVHEVKGGARGAEIDGRALVFQNDRLVLLEPVECLSRILAV